MNRERIQLFEQFSLDLARGCLLRAGQPIHLRPQSYEVLKYLAENKGRLISKDQLIEEVWKGRAVTDGSLGKCIEEVREALGEDARLYVRNVRGRGYIFDPETNERKTAVAQPVWSEQLDVVRVVVEEEQQEDSSEVNDQAKVMPAEALLPGSRRKTSKSKAARLSLAGAIVVVLALGMAYYLSSSGALRPGTSSVKSLAVLPFKSIGGDTNHEYLELGMAHTLMTRLSTIQEIAVRPTSSVLKYADTGKEAIEIGRELGVESVLEGSVHILEGRIRVTVQLVNVKEKRTMWADTFDEQFTDIFAVEDSISRQVAERLALKLSSEERQALARHFTENTQAHLLYLKGRYRLTMRAPDAIRKAIEFFDQATEEDPTYALAYAGRAESYISLSVTGGMPPREAFPLAKQAATKALEIDPHLADAHTSLGIAKFWHDWDWSGAERDFKRAIEVNPNYAPAHEMYAHLLSNTGRHTEGLAESSRALELDPLSLISNAIRGQMLVFAGQYDEAIAQLQKTIDVEPNFWIAHLTLGKVYERKKMYSEATAEFQKAWDLSGGSPETKSLLAYTYAVSGERAEANRVLDELKSMSTRQYVAPKHVALIYAGLGDKDSMFEWLDKAYEDRDISLTFIKVEPRWDVYRNDPRFKDLLRRVGF